jgi:hypothetical protein
MKFQAMVSMMTGMGISMTFMDGILTGVLLSRSNGTPIKRNPVKIRG